LETSGSRFGYLILTIECAETFEPYRPFLSNFANFAAIILEKRWQEKQLESANEELVRHKGHLEEQVSARTRELFLANEALSKGELRYRTLFERSNDAIFLVDGATGRYLEANKAAEELTGRSQSDLKKQTTRDVTPEGARNRLAAATSMDKTLDLGEVRYLRPDGTERIAVLDTIPLDENTIFGIAHDITERKRAEEELRESERKTRAIFDQTFQFVGLMEPDGTLIEANRAVLDAFEIEASDVIGKLFWETSWWTHSPEQQKQLRAGARRAAAGEFYSFESHHPAPDGTIRYIDGSLKPVKDETGKVVLIIPEGRDITERKQAEEALRKNEQLYGNILESMSDGILVLDRDFHYVHWNRAMEVISGVQREELVGSDRLPWQAFPHLREQGVDELMRRAMCGEVVQRDDIPYRLPDGTEGATSEIYFPLKTGEGEVTGIVGVIRDITEHRALKDQLRHVQKMEAIGELSSGIAHDFSNLVTVIGASSEALETLLDDDGARVEVDRIQKASEQAGRIASSLLAFSRSVPLEKSSLRLKSVLEDTAVLLRHSLPAVVELIVEMPDEPVGWVYADGTQLQRVLLNLGLNARDAMPSGGTIRLSLSLPTGDPVADSATPSECAPRYARITMTDTGKGIPAEIRSRIFEPFFTTKPRGHGTGLGLSTSHGIVEEHGGRIELEPQADGGASFSVYLPWEGSPRNPEKERLSGAVIRGEGQLVLVAEDHEQIRAALASTLESLGFQVVQADNGKALLERFEEHRDAVRLMVVDVDLPQRNGLTCLSDLRADGVEVPTVVITGADPAGFFDLAGDDHVLLCKPFLMSEFAEVVATVLASSASDKVSS
jgi:PAS domain S-box-containing protein